MTTMTIMLTTMRTAVMIMMVTRYDDGNDEQEDYDGDNVALGCDDEDRTEDHERVRADKYELRESRSNRSGIGRITRSQGEPVSGPSTDSTRAARASQQAERDKAQDTGYQPKGKRGRPQQHVQRVPDPAITRAVQSGGDESPQGTDGTSRSSGTRRQKAKEADTEQAEDNADERPPSYRTMRVR